MDTTDLPPKDDVRYYTNDTDTVYRCAYRGLDTPQGFRDGEWFYNALVGELYPMTKEEATAEIGAEALAMPDPAPGKKAPSGKA